MLFCSRYLLRPLGLEIDYVNLKGRRDHIYLTFVKPEDRQILYHKLISQVRNTSVLKDQGPNFLSL